MDKIKNLRYGQVARYLHGLIASLIVSQYILANLAEDAEHSGATFQHLVLLANHKSIGMTILMLAVVRLCWRFYFPGPALPNNMMHWQKMASRYTHGLLYALIFVLPLSGWLMSSAASYSVSWFNLFSFPDLVSADESLKSLLMSVHEFLATSLFVLALVHIVAALKHRFFDYDDVLQRMVSGRGIIAAVVLAVIVVTFLGRAAITKSENKGVLASTESAQADSKLTAIQKSTPLQSQLPVWNIDYSNSYIHFSGEQAGAEFEGQFSQWKGIIHFSADDLSQSFFNIEIDLGSVDTDEEERNLTLLTKQFFYVDQFPTAIFTAAIFSTNTVNSTISDNYQTMASLSIKGHTVPAMFKFSVTERADSGMVEYTLVGSARLDRFNYEVGSGEWADTEWVGQFVNVDVLVVGIIQ